MKDPIQLTLPWPPSVNHYWRHVGHKTLISAAGRAYRIAVGRYVLQNLRRLAGVTPYQGKIGIHIAASFPDDRKRDLDNLLKAPFDALTHARIWKDDSQIQDFLIRRVENVKGGQLVLDIYPRTLV